MVRHGQGPDEVIVIWQDGSLAGFAWDLAAAKTLGEARARAIAYEELPFEWYAIELPAH
jgi:hypothetical protein